MGITFREAVAEVELGLVAGDHLPDVATAGLLEGYDAPALAALAARFGEPFDPVANERLWSMALVELNIELEGTREAARVLVRAYARLVAHGELPPQLGASKIDGLHKIARHRGCDQRDVGDCIDAEGIIRLFYAHHGRGYVTPMLTESLDLKIREECRRLTERAG